ncbi:zinc finger protein 761-like [Musca vetustissima]|uniref:zinc finger protein 761-like n=1 Tax=Musca vetustissima TaxID=27455 RepID=UPI002AB634FB|nr:zinc finger protein 761-like [Musca vetustissima]
MACLKCDRFFQDKDVFEQHMFSHENKYIFECPHCPKTYTNRSSLTSHMDIYHNHQMKPLQCDHCYKIFVNQASYRSHIKAHMPEAKITAFICLECGLMSNNEEFIQNHIDNEVTTISPDTPGEMLEKIVSVAYTCECCSLDYFSQKHLQKHRGSPKHNDNLYYCPICRKTFKTLKHMRNHMTKHKDYDEWLNEFPIARFYMCNIGDCMDAYPLWSSLYYHKKRHKNNDTSNKKYPCQFCEKVCETKMSLAVHIARVHNNNNIKCQHCKKSYKNEKDLKHHLERMHVTMQCSKCDKVFKNQRNLISHEQLVHENMKRYFCSHCEKGYYYQSELKAHEKNVSRKYDADGEKPTTNR